MLGSTQSKSTQFNQAPVVIAGIAVSITAGAVASAVGLEVPATLLVMGGVAAIDAISNRKATPTSASEESVPDKAENLTNPTDAPQSPPTEVIKTPGLEVPVNPQPPRNPEAVVSVPKPGGRAPRRKAAK